MVKAARVRLETGVARGDRCPVRVARLARMVVAGRCRRGGDVPWKCIQYRERPKTARARGDEPATVSGFIIEINHVSKHWRR